MNLFPKIKKIPADKIYLCFCLLTSLFYNLAFTVNLLYFIEIGHLDPLQLLLVGTTLEASVFIFEIPTGIVADIYSRRLSIVIGIFIIGCGFLLMGAWSSFPMILLSQVLWGVGYTFTSGALEAWISDEIGEEKTPLIFLRGTRYGQLGSIAGILLAMLLGLHRLNTPILTSGGLFLAFGFYLMAFMPEKGFKPAVHADRPTFLQTARKGLGMLRRRPALYIIFWVGLFLGMYSEGYDRLWTSSMLERFSFIQSGALPEVIWFGLLRIGTMILTFFTASWMEKQLANGKIKNSLNALTLVCLCLGVALFGFALVQNFPLVILFFLSISVFRNISDPLYLAWANHHLDSRVRATILSMNSQVNSLGQILSGPLIGLIARQVSLKTGLLFSSLLFLPVLGFLFFRSPNMEN